LKPVFKAGTKGLRFGLEVGWAFVKPGVRLSRGGRMYSMIIPIPPINLSANVEAAYKKIRELRNKNEFPRRHVSLLCISAMDVAVLYNYNHKPT
jgi:hypothetical protein